MTMQAAGAEVPFERALRTLGPHLNKLWGTVRRLGAEGRAGRVLVTAARSGAGASTLAAGLAWTLARNLRVQVDVLEAAVDAPAIASYLGLRATPGVAELLAGRAELADCRREVAACPGLSVVPAGAERDPIPGEFATERGRALLAELARRSRYLVIDAPPVLDRPETRVLGEGVDGAILVVRARETRKRDAEQAARLLDESGVRLLGTVLTHYRSDLPFADR